MDLRPTSPDFAPRDDIQYRVTRAVTDPADTYDWEVVDVATGVLVASDDVDLNTVDRAVITIPGQPAGQYEFRINNGAAQGSTLIHSPSGDRPWWRVALAPTPRSIRYRSPTSARRTRAS